MNKILIDGRIEKTTKYNHYWNYELRLGCVEDLSPTETSESILNIGVAGEMSRETYILTYKKQCAESKIKKKRTSVAHLNHNEPQSPHTY